MSWFTCGTIKETVRIITDIYTGLIVIVLTLFIFTLSNVCILIFVFNTVLSYCLNNNNNFCTLSIPQCVSSHLISDLKPSGADGFVYVCFPAAFWSALGGKKDYQTSKSLQNMVKPPRLFGCSNKTGRLSVSHKEK